MEYKPNDSVNYPKEPGKGLPKGTVKHIERCLVDGKTVDETAQLCSVNQSVVSNFRKKLIAEGKLDLASWKRSMQQVLAEASMKAACRLNDEIDNISPGQLALTMAIMTDKVQALSDTPQAVVIPARLQISQDDLNKALSAFDTARNVIDVTPEKKSEKSVDSSGETSQGE